MPPLSVLAGKALLIKSHQGSVELDEWIRAQKARILLSVRDPRDAAISMAQRFKTPLSQTALWLARDCERAVRLMNEGHPVFRYEDRFFEDRLQIERVGGLLGLSHDSATCKSAFSKFRRDAVREFASGLDKLPNERIVSIGPFKMDRVTQILEPHVGDGRIGKWRALPPLVAQSLTDFFQVFLEKLGYER